MATNRIYDFSAQIEPLSEEGQMGDPAGQFLGMILANSQGGKTEKIPLMKAFAWSKQLLKGTDDRYIMLLDKEDVKQLKDFVEKNPMLNTWTKGAILEVLEGDGEPIPKMTKSTKATKKAS